MRTCCADRAGLVLCQTKNTMVKFSFLFRRLPGMSFDAFTDYHKNKHAPLFASIPEAERYVRKYIITHAVEAPGFPKPLYDSITEIWFDSFEDYHTFFATKSYRENVHPDEYNFMDHSTVVVMITNVTVIKDK